MIGSARHGSDRAVTDGGEHALDEFGRAYVIPMLGEEVGEGEQLVAILCQAVDRLVVSRAIFLGKDVDRLLGLCVWTQDCRSVQRSGATQTTRRPCLTRLCIGFGSTASLIEY